MFVLILRCIKSSLLCYYVKGLLHCRLMQCVETTSLKSLFLLLYLTVCHFLLSFSGVLTRVVVRWLAIYKATRCTFTSPFSHSGFILDGLLTIDYRQASSTQRRLQLYDQHFFHTNPIHESIERIPPFFPSSIYRAKC